MPRSGVGDTSAGGEAVSPPPRIGVSWAPLRPHMTRIALALVIMWLWGGLSCAQAERRVALVVSNAAYIAPPLRNPVEDAQLT